jgi:hypothetical protein
MPDRATRNRERVEKEGLVLPRGLDGDTLAAAIEIIEAWEMEEGTMATYLALDLFELFLPPRDSHGDAPLHACEPERRG